MSSIPLVSGTKNQTKTPIAKQKQENIIYVLNVMSGVSYQYRYGLTWKYLSHWKEKILRNG